MLGYSGRFRTFAPTDFLSGKAMARTGLRMMPTRTDPACPRAQAAVASNPRSDPIQTVRPGPPPTHSSSRPFRLAMKSVLHWSIGVVKRCEIDPMPCSNCLNLLDPLLSDGPSSLREGFEAALQSQSHAFE